MKNSLRKISTEEKERILEMHNNEHKKEFLNERKLISKTTKGLESGAKALGKLLGSSDDLLKVTKKFDINQNLPKILKDFESEGIQLRSKLKINKNLSSLFNKYSNDFLKKAGQLSMVKGEEDTIRLTHFHDSYMRKTEGQEIKVSDLLHDLEQITFYLKRGLSHMGSHYFPDENRVNTYTEALEMVDKMTVDLEKLVEYKGVEVIIPEKTGVTKY